MVGRRGAGAHEGGCLVIFVSYAREDAATARRLVDALQAAGRPCVLDPTLPQGDAFWRDALATQMARCRCMAVVVSPHADASPWVQQERRGFAAIGPSVPVHSVDDDSVRRIVACHDGAGGTATFEVPDAAASHAIATAQAQRDAARAHGEALVSRVRAEASARAPRAECGDGRAWLADGRIALIRLPGSPGRMYVATEPLSNALYREFLAAHPDLAPPPTWRRAGWDADALPVTGITWYEAAACAAWFGGRLPDEAAWHWAARGGEAGLDYATADGTLSPALAHHDQPFARGMPRATSDHPATPAGFRGLCGNTWDWCADAWGPHRVLRGGGWMDDARHCRVDARYRNAPQDRDACVGLRLAFVRDPA